MIFENKVKIGLKDIGIEGLCSNKAILGILEDTAGFHSDCAGYGVSTMPQTKITWVLLDWKVEIHKRPQYGEELTVKTWTKHPERYHVSRDFEVINKNGESIILATSKWVFIDLQENSIKQVPNEVIEKYGPEDEKNAFEDEKLEKTKIPEEFDMEKVFEVSRNNIDINKHMNNVYFLDYAYNIIPFSEKEFSNIRITYKTEIKYGNKVKAFYKQQEGKNIVVLKTEDEKKIHAIIELF